MYKRTMVVLSLLGMIGCGDNLEGDVDPGFVEVAWTDVTAEAKVFYEGSYCVVFDDLDGDGWADIMTSGPLGGWTKIFRNKQDGTFETIDLDLGEVSAISCVAADFTNDGRLDIVMGTYPAGVAMLRNMGDLEFTLVTDIFPELDHDGSVYTMTAGVIDYDRDGWLDVYLGEAVGSANVTGCEERDTDFACYTEDPPTWRSETLLHNEQGAAFSEVPLPGSQNVAINILGVGMFDFDGDGWLDMFVNRDFGINSLYRNLEGEGFEDLAPALGLDDYNHAMGSAFGDWNGDGYGDLYVTDVGPDQFWFGKPDGSLECRVMRLGIGEATRYHSGWSPLAGDMNNDGFLDLVVFNSALTTNNDDLGLIASALNAEESVQQADFYWLNDTQGGFVRGADIPQAEGAAGAIAGIIAGYADYDHDGDLDVLESIHRPTSFPMFQFRLLRNDPVKPLNWLEVDLVAPDGHVYGAEVEAIVDGQSWGKRMVHGSSGGIGQNMRMLHFGLGTHDTVDELVVTWLGGETQRVPGPIDVNQIFQVTQGD